MKISGAFGFETGAAVKKSRPRFSVQGTRRPRNGRGGGHFSFSFDRKRFILARFEQRGGGLLSIVCVALY